MEVRGRQLGSFRRRRDRRHKCWEGRVWLGGKRVSVYCRTRQEAVRKVAQLVAEYYSQEEKGVIVI